MEKSTEQKEQRKIKFVVSEYDKDVIKNVDAFHFCWSVLGKRKKKTPEEVIERLTWELSLLYHYLSHKDPEFVEFLNKVKICDVTDDDSLDANLNPPNINDDEDILLNNSIVEVDKEESLKW